MIYLFLQILTLNEIFCYRQIPGTFDKDNALEGYITPEDNMLIFSYNISQRELKNKTDRLFFQKSWIDFPKYKRSRT